MRSWKEVALSPPHPPCHVAITNLEKPRKVIWQFAAKVSVGIDGKKHVTEERGEGFVLFFVSHKGVEISGLVCERHHHHQHW